MSTTEVEHLTVGCPERITLKFVGVVFDVRHLVLYRVVGNEVALCIIDLDLGGTGKVEYLFRLICGIDNQRQCRMPCRIDTGRED